jgi:asparagine synthase (glutamine-hydrolysing)
MCGIAGIVDSNPSRVQTSLTVMTAAQAHRGPDDQGITVQRFGTGYLGMGHRRLSILDLSSAGHQPMVHSHSGSSLIFNGEIYNFRELRCELEREGESFLSGSDTEVLLAGLVRHGESFLNRLEGMFALAFNDIPRQRLLLARDPVGIKPLYVALVGTSILFASEIRAILASGLVPPTIDRRGAAGLLAYGAVQQPLTLFQNISSLPPGHWQAFQPDGSGAAIACVPRKYWSYPSLRRDVGHNQAIEAVRDTLDLAVRDHLISDVPVGLFLSSGIDSTILAALAGKHCAQLQSFTVGFVDQANLSEHEAAAETARLFGLRHTSVELTPKEAETGTYAWLASMDQPSMDGLNVYVISQAVRRYGIKVALSGLGADEIFGGYPSFRDVPRLHQWLRYLHHFSPGVRRSVAHLLTIGRHEVFRHKLMDILGSSGKLKSIYLRRRRLLSDGQLSHLGINAAALDLTRDYLIPATDGDEFCEGDDPIRALGEYESTYYQGNMLLRDSDANGMAHGLEIRVPYLDRRLLDLVHALPGSIRLPRRAPGKYLLREAFKPVLRPALQRQKKRGFVLPIKQWMMGNLRDWCEDSLRGWKDLGWLDPKIVDNIWQRFLKEPDGSQWTRPFMLCTLGHYLSQTKASV